MNILETLEALESSKSKLKALKKLDSPVLREILAAANSPTKHYKEKLPSYKDKGLEFEASQWRSKLFNLLDGLRSGQFFGKEREAVSGFLNGCNATEAKWAKRILKNDLDLGLKPEDINKTLGSNVVFQFSAPKATDFKELKDYSGKWCVIPKIGGLRSVVYLPANKGQVVLFDSSGKEIEVVPYLEPLFDKLQEINNSRNPVQGLVLDGEIITDDHGLGKLLVQDGGLQPEWENPQRTYPERYRFLNDFVRHTIINTPGAVSKIAMVDMFSTVDPDLARMIRYSQDYVSKGFEGVYFRKSTVPVVNESTPDFLEVKTFFDDIAVVISPISGAAKYETILGGIKCRTQDGVEFEIFEGFTADQRRKYWKDRENLPSYVAYKYDVSSDNKTKSSIFKGFLKQK